MTIFHHRKPTYLLGLHFAPRQHHVYPLHGMLLGIQWGDGVVVACGFGRCAWRFVFYDLLEFVIPVQFLQVYSVFSEYLSSLFLGLRQQVCVSADSCSPSALSISPVMREFA